MTRYLSDMSGHRPALVGLLVLVLVDVLLVGLAFRPDPAELEAVARPTLPPAATGAGGAEDSPEGATQAVPVRRAVAAVDGTTAWRATLGACTSGGASLEVSRDAGRTWQRRTAPARAIGRIQPVSPERGFLVGAGEGCRAGEYVTRDAGATWLDPRAIDGGWSRQPGRDAATVITPAGSGARPCGADPVVDLVRVSATAARVLCAPGRVVASSDGGRTWSPAATVEGALAVSARVEGKAAAVFLARGGGECAGVEVVRLEGGRARRVACVEVEGGVPAGQVSLSVVPAAGWLAVGDRTFTAGADLGTWRAAS